MLFLSRNTLHQFSKFAIIGGISTAISYGVFILLFELLSVAYIPAAATGYMAGLLFGFSRNRAWTFRSANEKKWREFISYLCVYAFSLVASMLLLKLLVESVKIDPRIANVIAIGFSTMTNFIGCKLVVFR